MKTKPGPKRSPKNEDNEPKSLYLSASKVKQFHDLIYPRSVSEVVNSFISDAVKELSKKSKK